MRRVVVAIAMLAGLAAWSAAGAPPADASTCVFTGSYFTEAWTPSVPSNAAVSRGMCWQVKIEYNGSQYRFKLQVQDTKDVCNTSGGGCNRDGGVAGIQVASPCSGCTNPFINFVSDKNSADFVPSNQYVSPWYTPVVHGPLSEWDFRPSGSTEYKPLIGSGWVQGSYWTGGKVTF